MTPGFSNRSVVSCGILGLGLAMAPARGIPQDAQAPASAVSVSAWVLERSGQPVADLQAQDFEVVVDGRPRALTSVATRPLMPPAPGGVSRRVVMTVNRPSLAAGADRRLLEAAAAFVERLGPTELAAAWPIPAEHAELVFTSDRKATRDALLSATGTRPAPLGRHVLSPGEAASIARGNTLALDTAAERACPQGAGARDEVARCREELRREAGMQVDQARDEAAVAGSSLRPLVRALESTRGVKHLVLLTGGVVFTDEMATLARTIAAEAAAARVTIHAVQIQQPGAGRGSDADATLELVLARETGGLAVSGLAAGDAFDRLGRALAAEYTLAFVPEDGERDGRLHQLDVRVSRRGAYNVRAPRQLRIDPAPLPSPSPEPTPAPAP